MKQVRTEESASVTRDSLYWERRIRRESTYVQDKPDAVRPEYSAEDEVVSVFVSAMMGFIVETWHGEPLICKEVSTDITGSQEISEPVESVKTESLKQSSEVKKTRRELCKLPSSVFSSKSQVSQKQPSIQAHEEISEESESKQTDTTGTIRDLSSLENYFEMILSGAVQNMLEEWRFQEKDEQAVIEFRQGNRYEGTMSRSLMHGQGTFYWADGGRYQGDFRYGEITGNGRMDWSDQTWYEGEFYKGYRYGRGTLVIDSSIFFIGNYCMGKMHGLGYICYKNPQETLDFYNGMWVMGEKEGTGLRVYESGARYSGYWLNNQRHGLGTMVWSNNDVYSGNWNEGKMHGYGEYTWSTFFNKHFVIPNDNCYYGEWKNGLRHGSGTLELSTGTAVRGNWHHGLKEGRGQVVCCNGTFVYSDNLFQNDTVHIGSDNTPTDHSQPLPITSAIPINAPCHDININVYLDRLVEYRQYCKLLRKPFRHINKNAQGKPTTTKYFLDIETEEKWLSNVLARYRCVLKQVYKAYAEISHPLCTTGTTLFKPVMARIMLWQMFRDWGFHKRGLSLAEIDIIIAKNKVILMESYHYPFERIRYWQFLHCIIELSWVFYVEQQVSTDKIPGILGAALNKLINSDILPNSEYHIGNALFQYRDLLPLEGVYNLYKYFGDPHSARVMVRAIMIPDTTKAPANETTIAKGKNIVGLGGKLMYLTEETSALETQHSSGLEDKVLKTDLSCVADIGLQAVIKCLTHVCPGIVDSSLYVNMEYKMVFLEFYEVLLLCAIGSVTLQITKEKQMKLEAEKEATKEENGTESKIMEGDKDTESKPTTSKTKKNISKTKKSDKKKKKAN